MEEEISLIEIITTLWKGKYIIISVTLAAMLIAALFSFFMITPLYKATATFNPAPYNYKAADVARTNGNNTFLYNALEDLLENPDAILSNLTITAEGELVVITAEQPEPQLAVDAADAVALAIAQTIANDYLETLSLNIFNLQSEIKFFEEKIDELYPGASLANNEALLEDPIYLTLRQQQGVLTRDLLNAMFAHEQVQLSDKFKYEQHLSHASLPKQPINQRWQLNIAVAAVLGFMLSVMLVFISPFFRTIKSELQKST